MNVDFKIKQIDFLKQFSDELQFIDENFDDYVTAVWEAKGELAVRRLCFDEIKAYFSKSDFVDEFNYILNELELPLFHHKFAYHRCNYDYKYEAKNDFEKLFKALFAHEKLLKEQVGSLSYSELLAFKKQKENLEKSKDILADM